MEQITDFSDERNKSWCIHCGAWMAAVRPSRDHVPSKSLLVKPYPGHLPAVMICDACNSGFSRDEEYLIAFLSAVLAGSTDPEHQHNRRAATILRRGERLGARIERSKTAYRTEGGETRLVWQPEEDRVSRVVVKNARGHALYEYGEPMIGEPECVWMAPLPLLSPEEREDFETLDSGGLWPEVGSRMMTRIMTGQDLVGCWVTVQPGIYRYAVALTGGIIVRSVLHEYLATEVVW